MTSIQILDTRFFANAHDAALAFARAAGCNGGYAPKHFGLRVEQVGGSTPISADGIVALTLAANDDAQAEHEAEQAENNPNGYPCFNSPAEIDIIDERTDLTDPAFYVLWGTGRTIVLLEQDQEQGGEWSVSVGLDNDKWDGTSVTRTAGGGTRSSVVLSMARRIAARDADLHEAEMARELAQVAG